jgi:site-specific DNA-methyltransferase (adenine-specific)
MARDLILSYSRPGDLVFDPLCGAGTTCKMALLNHRHYLGMEFVERYVEIARKRVRLAREALDQGGPVPRAFDR